MVRCVLPGCSSTKKRGLSFFKFPSNESFWEEWKINLKEAYKDQEVDLNKIAKGFICSLHFEEKYMISNNKQNKRYLTENAVPTNFANLNMDQKTTPKRKKSQTDSLEVTKNSVCRLCLKESKDTKVLTLKIRYSVELLINSPIKISKVYSNLICRECSKNVEKFTVFRSKIIQNQEKLCELNEIEIKKEPEEFSEENFNCFENVVKDDGTEYCNVKIEDPGINLNNQYTGTQSDNESDIESEESKNLNEEEFEKKVSRRGKRIGKYGKLTYKQYTREKIDCEVCGRKVSRLNMKSHLATKHNKNDCSFECDICGARFFYKLRIKEHVSLHKSSKDFVCEHCNKTFLTSTARHNHIFTNHKKELVCEQCGEVFKHKEALKRHKLIVHVGERKFLCSFSGCNKTFFTTHDLRNHEYYVHSGSQTCDICGFVSSSLAAKRKHDKKHLGNIYYCNYIVVNGEKCGKVFSVEGALKNHQKSHFTSKDFNCPACFTKFKYQRPLITHYLTTHSTYRMNCFVEGCSAAFVHKDTFRQHIKSAHAYGEEFVKDALQKVNKIKIPKLEELIEKY